MVKMYSEYDVIVVGAGISGATLAERYATQLNKKVLVIEKRDHIGGNCYDFINEAGILVSKYGAHLFHTNYEDVWKYINNFSEWIPYEHHVLSYVNGKYVPVPVNIDTVNMLFGANIQSSKEMKAWLEEHTEKIDNPKDSEEAALRRVGKELYELIFKNYTKKQWDVWPKELESSVMDRIPVRPNFDNRYFSDKYQVLPKDGYTKMFKRMLDHPNITLKLNSDWEDMKGKVKRHEKVFFTGPIDQFFNNKYKPLQYRSIRFEFETHDKEYYQQNSVINYPNDYAYTRIVEYKYFGNQKNKKTTISKEYSMWEGEPYYPVPSERNRKIYEMYQKEAQKLEEKGIYFVGRLANYKYFNMDQAFKNALDLFERIKI